MGVPDPLLARIGADPGVEPLLVGQDRVCTSTDLCALANRVRRYLQRATLPRHGLVGLVAADGPAFLAGFVALRQAHHPVLLFDEATPHEEQHRVAISLGATALLRLPEAWPTQAPAFELERLRGDCALPDTAVVKLTSGSTGDPRGIAVTTANLVADAVALRETMGIRDGERFLAAIPWSHSYGFSMLVLPALLRPATLILPDGRDPLAAAEEGGATLFPTASAYLQAALHRDSRWPKRVIAAGAPLPPTTAAVMRKRHRTPVHVFYGASECGGISYDRTGRAGERGTVGTPVRGVAIELRRRGHGHTVSVRSPAVATTYVPTPRPELRDGRFDTDDLADWQNGELVLHGRATEWINVDGRKVRPEEVRRVLTLLNGVLDAFVFGRSAREGGKETVRAVVACPGGELDYRRVHEWCCRHLAAHKVPRSVAFVRSIPYTSRGKPDREAMAARFASC